jgi:hypothetical protein
MHCLHLQNGSGSLKMEAACSSKTLVSTYKTQPRKPQSEEIMGSNVI